MSLNKKQYYTSGRTLKSKGNQSMLNAIERNAYSPTGKLSTKRESFVNPELDEMKCGGLTKMEYGDEVLKTGGEFPKMPHGGVHITETDDGLNKVREYFKNKGMPVPPKDKLVELVTSNQMFASMATLPKVKWDTPTFSKNTSMVKHTTLPNKEQPQFDKLSSDEPSYETKLADEGVYSPEGYDIMYYQGQPLDPEIYGYAESTTGSVPLENITSNPAIWMFNRKNQMQKWNESGDYPWGKRYKFATGGEVLELTDEEIQELRKGGHIVIEQ